MPVSIQCPQCGTALPADAPAGLCPECLLRQGFDSAACSASKTPTVIGAGFVPPTPAELAGRFPQLEILELLGKGGMGAVYKARQPSLDRHVALKVLPPEVGKDPSFAERFAREARALARLNHQNIVAIYDFGEADGLFYFAMEYVDGANLRQVIQGGLLTPVEALAIVPQICAALQFAHEEGIVHRDVKPENILVDRRGRVKIADFGLAKLLRVQKAEVTLTQAQQVMGTWHYMAPEQVEHPQSVDHRADIYSLGVVFYEMLTGQLPLGKFDLPSQKSQVDARIDQVVLRALEREPERRYQYVSEVQSDVETINGSKPQYSSTSSDISLNEALTTLAAGWLDYAWMVFCIAAIAMGLGAAWQFGTLGRWGGPALVVDPDFAWLRWPLVGLGLLVAAFGGAGLTRLGNSSRGATQNPGAGRVHFNALQSGHRRERFATWGGLLFSVLLIFVLVLSVSNFRVKPEAATVPGDATTDTGVSELHQAAADGDLKKIRQLLAAGADVNAVDPLTGETPLMKAADNGQSAAAVVLLMRRANEQARDRKKMTPLMHAVAAGHGELAKLFTQLRNIDSDEELQFRITRLDTELPADTDFKSMRFDAALEAQDEDGETALMKAAAQGRADVVETIRTWLRDEGTTRDRQGRTAVMHAIMNHQTSFLLAALEEAEESLLHSSPGSNMSGFACPETLSASDNQGKTALMLTRELGEAEVAEALQDYLQHVVEIESRGVDTETPTLWYIYYIRGHARLGLGQTEDGNSDLDRSRELRR